VNKQLFKYLRFIITLCLLGLVFYLADLFSPEGRKLLIDTVKNADLRVLVAAVLIGVVINMVSTLKFEHKISKQVIGVCLHIT